MAQERGDGLSSTFSESMQPFRPPGPGGPDADGPPRGGPPPAGAEAPPQPIGEKPEPDAEGADAEDTDTEPLDTTGADAFGGPDLQPPPEDGPAPAEQPIGALPVPSEDNDVIAFAADRLEATADGTRGWGDIQLGFDRYVGIAERFELDKQRVWATLEGNVVLTSPDTVTEADHVELNIDSEHWHAFDTYTTIAPEFFEQGEVIEPLFAQSQRIHGHPGELEVHGGRVSSCDLLGSEDGHYLLQSEYVRIVPGEYVVLRRPTLYLLGNRIIQYPFDLRLSLRQRTNKFIPEVGQNEVEGFFAKFAFAYLLNEANSGILRINLTEKRGIGYGTDHDFDFGKNYGTLRAFFEPSEGSYSGRLQDRHQFNEQWSADLTSNLQRSSGYSSSTTSLSNNFNLLRRGDLSTTSFGLQQSLTQTEYNTNRRLTANLMHKATGTEKFGWELRSNFSRNAYRTDQPADSELTTELRLDGKARAFDWDGIIRQRTDVDGDSYTGDDSFYALDLLPEIQFNTDSRRLGDWEPFGISRITAKAILGGYSQQPDGTRTERAAFELRMPGQTRHLFGDLSLNNSLQFKQQFTGEGSAQFYYNLTSEIRGRAANYWDYRLSYNRGTANGYSPLRIGYSGQSSYLSLQTVCTVPNTLSVSINTGYDYVNDTYRDVTMQTQWMMARDNRLELQTGYSIRSDMWRPLNLRWLRASPNWYSAMTAYYDLDDARLSRATTEINWRLSRWWNFDIIAGYSGTNKEIDQLEFNLLRDLHCMIGSVSYNKELSEFRINIGIKAFPSDERQFGVGGGGARFESTFGDYY